MATTNYYTVVNLNNGKYVGNIYSKNNNQLVYTTPEYTSQAKMLNDTRNWFANQNTKTHDQKLNINTKHEQPKVATNTVQYNTTKSPISRRCCGRR